MRRAFLFYPDKLPQRPNRHRFHVPVVRRIDRAEIQILCRRRRANQRIGNKRDNPRRFMPEDGLLFVVKVIAFGRICVGEDDEEKGEECEKCFHAEASFGGSLDGIEGEYTALDMVS